jgi:hypothetical protein
MRALTKLVLRDNRLATAEAGEALGEALKGNTVLNELDISSNGWSAPSYKAQPDGPGFAKGISKGLAGNGAISSVNLLKNDISVEQAQELVKIMQSKEKLITLCGLSGKEATLDFSNQGLGPGDAVLIANDISDMRAMSKLIFGGDISEEYDRSTQAFIKHKPAVLEVGMTEADLSNRGLGVGGAIIVSTWISDKDKGAMMSLNLASNKLGVEGAKITAACLPKCT